MKEHFVKEITVLKEGEWVEDIFLVRSKQLLVRKDRKPYLMLKVGDKTGVIDCKLWDNTDEFKDRFTTDDFIMIKGIITSYQGTREINLKYIEKVDDNIINIQDFVAVSSYDSEDMTKELYSIINKFKNPYLQKLLILFYEDKDFMELFKIAPAAKDIHHAFMSGLLEHSIEVARLCIDIKRHFTEVDIDLLTTGAILHDIGKIRELKYRKGFDYTDEGRLIGHIVIGFEMINEKIRQIKDFPPKLEMILKHLIISHQGTNEWGSPKVPQTLEAIILHNMDDLSAKVNIYRKAIETDINEKGDFSNYNKALGRYLYKSRYTDLISSEDTSNTTDASGITQGKLF
ncbi:MAG TPA: HD family phosphohydrolase [Nitrospiraceae bacterium]|nr:HD family phosphohydrolase [Nitrospiraceae bacterium]